MSGTKLHSPKEPATEANPVVLIAHGSPSDPLPQEEALKELATNVASVHGANQMVYGATIAAPGSISAAFEGLPDNAVVFPVFMVDGVILRRILRDSLKDAGRGNAKVLQPLGLLQDFQNHCAKLIETGISKAGWETQDTTVVLAAHGSARGPRPAQRTYELAKTLQSLTGVKAVKAGFLEEAPFLSCALDAAPAQTLCLPIFATNAYHAAVDVPTAVKKANFTGPVLSPAGTVEGIAELIADYLKTPDANTSFL